MTTALSVQIGGTHYKDCAIQPIQYIEANRLDFLEGCVVKRLTRHDKPTGKGRQDIEKALHELQLLLELRYPIKVAVNDNKAGEWVPADERMGELPVGQKYCSCPPSHCFRNGLLPNVLCAADVPAHG